MSSQSREKDDADETVFNKYFDMRLFLSFMAALLPVILPLFMWGIGVENKLVLHSEQIRLIMEDQRRQDTRTEQLVTNLREDLKDVSRKMDRLLETSYKGSQTK